MGKILTFEIKNPLFYIVESFLYLRNQICFQILFLKNIFVSKSHFLCQKHFWRKRKHFVSERPFWRKTSIFRVKNKFVPREQSLWWKFWRQKHVVSKVSAGYKIFVAEQHFCVEMSFLSRKNILRRKIYLEIQFCVEKAFLCQNNISFTIFRRIFSMALLRRIF